MAVAAGDRVCLVLKRLLGLRRTGRAGPKYQNAAFRQQYNVGGYLNVCMHPFQSGRALRIAMLDRLISRMKTLPGAPEGTVRKSAQA